MKVKWIIDDEEKTLRGKPFFRGTGIPVERVLKLREQGYSDEEIMKMYPHLTKIHFEYLEEWLKKKGKK